MSRRLVTAAAAAVLLGAPTVLAFFSGGYFPQPRLIAGIVVWTLVLVLCVAGPAPLPRRLDGRLALGGLVLMTVWSGASVAWAPLAGPAAANAERLLLYVGAFLLAVAVGRVPAARRAVEPALAAGATIVVGYGISERVVPGLVTLGHSLRANGRLEQPITYWNGEGALAAVGFVLCARLAGDRSRSAAVRALAAAAVGLIVLIALAPSRAQLRACAVALAAGAVAALVAGLLPGPSSLAGTLAHRERDGGILLVALGLAGLAAAAFTVHRARRDSDREPPLRGRRQLLAAAGAAVVLALAGLVIGGLREKPSAAELGRASAGRLLSVSSNRYDYWRVGARAFGDHPVEGLGSGGFRVRWLRERRIAESTLEVHSLELEMAAELGLVGLLSLFLLAGGVSASAAGARRRHGALAAGPAAATLAWFLHASIDWDWQLPAVSLPAIALAGVLVALAEAPEPSGLEAAGPHEA